MAGKIPEDRDDGRNRRRGAGEQHAMFTWMKRRRLERLHKKLLEEARDLQRKGDIQAFAAKSAEAAEVEQQLAALTA